MSTTHAIAFVHLLYGELLVRQLGLGLVVWGLVRYRYPSLKSGAKQV